MGLLNDAATEVAQEQQPQAQSQPSQPRPVVQPNNSATVNGGSLLNQAAAEVKAEQPAANTPPPDTALQPSYLQDVQNHIMNTARAIWHGVAGKEETEAERGAPQGQAPKQLGFTNENVGYNVGALGRGVGQFLGGAVHDLVSTKMPVILPDERNISWSDPKANTLLGKYIMAPSAVERQKALAEAEGYTGAKGTEAVGHLLNTYIHTAGEYIPVAGPFVASLIDKAEGGDVGGAVAQVAALAAAHPVAKAAGDYAKETAGYAPVTQDVWTKLKADAEKATVPGEKPIAPAVVEQRGTVTGPRTLLRPTTQTTAGVAAPISALQQENPSAVTKTAANLLTNPGAAKEFQKTQTYPAAQRQLVSTIGQVVEDKIAAHNALVNGEAAPEPIAGTQTPSKLQTHDDAAKASYDTAQKTYKKADAIDARDMAAYQQQVAEATEEYRASVDQHNQNIAEYNANLAPGEKAMPLAVFDPNEAKVPEKPVTYSDLKADLDQAKADSASSDVAVRADAFKNGIPKAQKALDGWFKQHSDEIPQAEYDSAKKLIADSYRFQDIANGLRAATAKNSITGNTLRGLEATFDNRQIRHGQGPGVFKALLGDEGYDNWKTVTKLFDPIKGAPTGIKSWGMYALEVAAGFVAPHAAILGVAGTMATKFLMDRIMFNSAWGSWFSRFTNSLKDMVTREHGELGTPGTVGEPFGEGGAEKEFQTLMDQEGKAKAAPALAAPTLAPKTPSLLNQVTLEEHPDVLTKMLGNTPQPEAFPVKLMYDNSGSVTDLDGKDRVLQAIEAGKATIPVMVTLKDGSTEIIDQDPKVVAKQFGVTPESLAKPAGIGKPNAGVSAATSSTEKLAPTFFSKAEQVANQKASTGSGDSILAALRNNGVKESEIQWLGLDDYLKGKPKVSKADLQQYIKENQIRLEESTKGGPEEAKRQDLEKQRDKAYVENNKIWADHLRYGDGVPEWGPKLFNAMNEGHDVERIISSMPESLQQPARRFVETDKTIHDIDQQLSSVSGPKVSSPRFEQYTLPGEKQNYTELLLKLPEQGNLSELKEQLEKADEERTHYLQTLRPVPGDVELRFHDAQNAVRQVENKSAAFKSSHFDEPNVLAHTRFDDRTSLDGKKTLLLEELQSDWHQKGKKVGYQNPAPTKLPDGIFVVPENGKFQVVNREGNPLLSRLFGSEQEAKTAALTHYGEGAGNPGVPNAPFKSDWHELVVKRMLRHAAENGYDRLAWTTGEQQAARYDLSKHIGRVTYDPTDNTLQAFDPNGKNVLIETVEPKASAISEYIGTEPAQKLMEKVEAYKPAIQGEDEPDIPELKGLDLKVGGDWAKALYDRAIPNFLNKYAKKWGAKVGETELDTASSGSLRYEIVDPKGNVQDAFRNRAGAEDAVKGYNEAHRGVGKWTVQDKGTTEKVHSIDITPAMKKSVLQEGQPIAENQTPDWATALIGRAV